VTELLFGMVDTDQDGYLSQDEYLTFVSAAVRIDHEAARAGFQQLNTDNDGRLSVPEIVAGVQQMMLSNDPSAPGTAILGQH
jgi:hypothetical protein